MALEIHTIKTAIKQIPAPVKSFLLRALVFFLIWELAYNIFLLPNRLVDRPLCEFVGKGTASFINIIKGGNQAYCQTVSSYAFNEGELYLADRAVVFLGPNRLIGIADACNGLNLLVLFIGFIVVYPSKIHVKLIYSIVGIVAIRIKSPMVKWFNNWFWRHASYRPSPIKGFIPCPSVASSGIPFPNKSRAYHFPGSPCRGYFPIKTQASVFKFVSAPVVLSTR